ncbi:MAG: hypothetical protein IT572_02325 [Deltaproteobacteria bacterium]|nr:hypothetical protein [Deltaproteobacteria bacterium]
MSDIDISLLHRLVQSALAGNAELQAVTLPLMAAADSDGQPNEEDLVLSDAEIQSYVTRLREESRGNLSVLTRNRDELAGTLSAAHTRLTGAHASETVLQYLELAASQDGDAENLSAEEIEMLVTELTQANDQAQQLNAETLVQEVNTLLGHLRAMEAEVPEAFLPTDEAARRAPIDLNFLKHLPPTVFAGEDEQSVMLQNLLDIAGVDVNGRDADWSLTFDELQTFINSLPEEARAEFPEAELTMANFRFLALTLREEINAAMGAAVAEGGDAAEHGISLQALMERRSQISDPRVDQLFELAGDDGVLTSLDVERHLRRMEEENPGFLQGMLREVPDEEGEETQTDLQRATALFLAGARALAADYGAEAIDPAADSTGGTTPFDRNLYLSRQVLGDLERMRAGFTHRERQYAEENTIVGTIDFITWACTLGGALTWIGAGDAPDQSEEDIAEFGENILPRVGPTYRHLVREFVEMHDRERGEALQQLRWLIEHPPSDFTGDRSIPNALEYLRTHEDDLLPGRNARYYELLTDEVFQAERLWNIRSERSPRRAEEMWLSLANDLRDGLTSWWSTGTYAEGVRNLDFARAILHALRRESTDEAFRNRVHHVLQDSLGTDITDDEGNVVEEGGGEFGIWPPDWFRNYSDENEDGAASDGVLLVASLATGAGAFSFGRGAVTTAGRSAMGAGFLRFLGIRGTQAVVTAGAEAAATEATAASSGWFSRHMASWAARRVAAAEAAVANATTEAEITAARQALLRAQGVQRILTSPTMLSTAAETVAPNATGWWGRVVAAHPPIPEALARAAAVTNAETRAAATRALMARASVATLENISLRGLGRGLRWMSYEGIVSYGIAGYVFQHAPRHSNHPLIFDREYELSLPEGEAPSARAALTPGSDAHARAPRRTRARDRARRPDPSAATGALVPLGDDAGAEGPP